MANWEDSAASSPSPVSIATPFNHSTAPSEASTRPLRPASPLKSTFMSATRQFFRCPPRGALGRLVFVVSILGLFLGAAWGVFAEYRLWTTIYSLVFLLVISHCFGWVVSHAKLPPLLGMLISGFCLKNIPGINEVFILDPSWSSRLRTLALVVILLRAGLGLDPHSLRRLSFTVIRLAFIPCLVETLVIVLVTHYFLGLPVVWGFILGFVLAAVSPAVVVPSMIWCQEERLGILKGIPTLVIAAASIDDVLAITGFSVALGIAFDSGANLAFTIVRGPLEVIIGVGYGFLVGVIAWYIPHNEGADGSGSSSSSSPSFVAARFVLLLLLGVFSAFVFESIEFPGAGALGALAAAFVANLGWRRQGWDDDDANPVNLTLSFVWRMVAQPLLFGLIGAEIRATELEGETVGIGIACLCISLTFRVAASVLAVLGSGMNLKEKLFIPIAWLPKATVQAAIGATAYDQAKERLNSGVECGTEADSGVTGLLSGGVNGTSLPSNVTTAILSNATAAADLLTKDVACLNVDRGLTVLTLAVLAILITAPIGAVAISLTAPRLLEKAPKKGENGGEVVNGDKGEVDKEVAEDGV